MTLTQSLFCGRFQPVTKAHQKIIDYIFKNSSEDIIVICIVAGTKSSLDKLTNPFPVKLREIMLQKVCDELKDKYNKEYIIKVFPNGYIPDIVKELSKEGIEVKSFFCGKDREISYKSALKRQNMQDIQVITFDRNIESDEEISQTKVRKAFLKGDLEAQKKLLPDVLHKIVNDLYEYYMDVIKDMPKTKIDKFLAEIKHIDELPVEMFVNYIRDLLYNNETLLQSIKIDGIANIAFGYNNGDIYCQRRKGKIQIWYDVSDIPEIPQYNAIRSQFNFFKTWYEKNKEIFIEMLMDYKDKQFEFEFEILSSLYSNLIKYTVDKSKLVYLRVLPKFSDPSIDYQKLDKILTNIFKKFKNMVFVVKTENYVPEFDNNGEVVLQVRNIEEKWAFDLVEYIDVQKYIKIHQEEIEKLLNSLEKFLSSKVGDYITSIDEKYQILTVFEVLTVKLNRVKKEDREVIKSLKNLLSNIQKEQYVTNIKNLLVSYLNNVISQEKQEEIEGIVIRKLGATQDELVKIVDKETFSEINKYIHSFYDQLLDEINDIKLQIANILFDKNFVSLKQVKINNIDLDTLKISSQTYKRILNLLNDAITLSHKQIETLEKSPDIIVINDKEINVEHLKQKVKQQIMFVIYTIQEIIKSSDKLFIVKLINFLFKTVSFDINSGNEEIITEGGNQFDDVEPLHYSEIDLLLQKLEIDFFKKIKITKQDYAVLGSQKKTEISNDLDICISIDQFKKLYNFNTYDEQINILEQICLKYFGTNNVKRKNSIISIRYTFDTVLSTGEIKSKTVQIDFILANLEYAKEYFYSQYNKNTSIIDVSTLEKWELSSYKAVYRNVLLQNLLSNQYSNIITDGEYEYRYQFTLTPTGIYKVTKQRKQGTKTWKIVNREIVNDKSIVEFLQDTIGIKISFKDIATFENLLELIFKKLPLSVEQKEGIIRDFKEFCEKNDYIYPENLILQFYQSY